MMARLQYILREWVQNTFIFTLLVGSSALTPNFYVRGWNFDLGCKVKLFNGYGQVREHVRLSCQRDMGQALLLLKLFTFYNKHNFTSCLGFDK